MLDKDATVRCKAVAQTIKLILKDSQSQDMNAMAQETTTPSLLQAVTSRWTPQCSRLTHMPMEYLQLSLADDIRINLLQRKWIGMLSS